MNYKTYHLFFKNLSNPLRIKIIEELNKKSGSVSELSKRLKVEQSKLSHAFGAMKRCKIVVSKREGKQRIYSLNKKTIVPLLELINDHTRSFCDCSTCGIKNCEGRR